MGALQATRFATEVSDTQYSSARMRVRARRKLTSICYSYRVGKKQTIFKSVKLLYIMQRLFKHDDIQTTNLTPDKELYAYILMY